MTHTGGIPFDEYRVGQTFETDRRTITETDHVQFTTAFGFFEPLFMDKEYVETQTHYGKRIVPGALTFVVAEGLTILSGILHGTGMAFLGVEMNILGPVFIGDTLKVVIEVVDKRETRKPDRGIDAALGGHPNHMLFEGKRQMGAVVRHPGGKRLRHRPRMFQLQYLRQKELFVHVSPPCSNATNCRLPIPKQAQSAGRPNARLAYPIKPKPVYHKGLPLCPASTFLGAVAICPGRFNSRRRTPSASDASLSRCAGTADRWLNHLPLQPKSSILSVTYGGFSRDGTLPVRTQEPAGPTRRCKKARDGPMGRTGIDIGPHTERMCIHAKAIPVEIKAREKSTGGTGLLLRALILSRDTEIGQMGHGWMGTN